MPSAKQIARGLAAKGVKQQAAQAVIKACQLMEAVPGINDPETMAKYLRATLKPEEIAQMQKTIRDVLGVMSDIERTHQVRPALSTGGQSGK